MLAKDLFGRLYRTYDDLEVSGRLIKVGIVTGIVVFALSSMNVAFMVLYGINTAAVLSAVFGYVVSIYLLYYGFFVKDEPSLKERMRQEEYRADKKAKEAQEAKA